MKWVKSHLSYVITASVGAIAIAMLIMGMMMSTVAADMEKDRNILNTLNNIKGVNQKVIEGVKKEGEAIQEHVKKVQIELQSKSNHQPIVPQVFPKIEANNQAAPYKFKDEFKKRQQHLLVDVLHAMDAPNEDEYKRGESWMANQKAKAEMAKVLGVAQTAPSGTIRRPGPGLYSAAPGGSSAGLSAQGMATLSSDEMTQARIRVSVQRARQVYCYASLTSLDPRTGITEGSGYPTVEEMWYAQMSLWIQDDVLGALGQLNNQVAEKLPEKDRWVAHLPVKHLWNIWVGNYVPPMAGATGAAAARFSGGGGGQDVGPPPGDSGSVLTQRGTTPNSVDVIQFALKLVVDAQSLPTVIDEICKAGFFTPLRVTYEAVSPTTDHIGYIYGSDPVIQVRLEFEGCFMRTKYTKWMPETVAKDINEGKAGTQLSTGSGNSSPSMRSGENPGSMRPGARYGRGS